MTAPGSKVALALFRERYPKLVKARWLRDAARARLRKSNTQANVEAVKRTEALVDREHKAAKAMGLGSHYAKKKGPRPSAEPGERFKDGGDSLSGIEFLMYKEFYAMAVESQTCTACRRHGKLCDISDDVAREYYVYTGRNVPGFEHMVFA